MFFNAPIQLEDIAIFVAPQEETISIAIPKTFYQKARYNFISIGTICMAKLFKFIARSTKQLFKDRFWKSIPIRVLNKALAYISTRYLL